MLDFGIFYSFYFGFNRIMYFICTTIACQFISLCQFHLFLMFLMKAESI